MSIKFYKINDPYGFMGNFYRSRIFVGGRWWNNVEAPYQAAKTSIKEEEDAIWACKTGKEARDLGQRVKMRSDWDQVKDQAMYECLMAKFLQHSDLRFHLMATGDEELIEDTTTSNDMYWGCGADGTGKNMLGKTLMRVRKELQGE